MWEANHVWLIFDLVIFWTAVPHAFAAVMTPAALPLWLAVAGLVLRGARPRRSPPASKRPGRGGRAPRILGTQPLGRNYRGSG